MVRRYFQNKRRHRFRQPTPFYFSMSVSDVYSTVYSGNGTQYNTEKRFFISLKLNKVYERKKSQHNLLVPSALSIVALKVFDYINAGISWKGAFRGRGYAGKAALTIGAKNLPNALLPIFSGLPKLQIYAPIYIVYRPKFSDGETPADRQSVAITARCSF